MAKTTFGFKGLLAGLLMACAFSASAAEVSGVKFDESARVAGKDLVLNGAGLRTKFIIKVYAAGLYLTEKKNAVPEVLKLDGPRRMQLVMMRDISSDDFGQAFMTGLDHNIDAAEKSKYVSQISKFGELFGSIPGVKKGDVLHIDWIPASGTVIELNGKKLGEPIPDVGFYNAVLRIWLGDRPADSSLKPQLLGAR
ncbi:chalcone isomerase family protein [Massilia sp. R2A-15]|uniref:chalcone isomerase family protein n=1 Tax=Massilia sp. R2A-15 TaxID=3064278 RepID=UPI002736A18B|nr:chalcone isomerase family protein [Massilia sp. R2A-15]WLI89065.1 chalcone isomerase family protein [Massilia sp. R2A-15]